MKKEEDILQAKCYLEFNNKFCLKHHSPRLTILSIPNGGFRHKLEAIKLKATGLLKGASDLIILYPGGKIVFFEAKKIGGVHSPDQKEFQKRVNDLGFDYELFYTFDEFWTKSTKHVTNSGHTNAF